MKIDYRVCKRFTCVHHKNEGRCHLVESHNQVARSTGDEIWETDEVPENCSNYVEFMLLEA
jgi:hypothetical protein